MSYALSSLLSLSLSLSLSLFLQDIIARLRRMHVEEVVRCRCDWAKKEYEWRQLRHTRALHEFHLMIESVSCFFNLCFLALEII